MHGTTRMGAGQVAQGRRARRAWHGAQGYAHKRGDTAVWAAIRQGASATTRPGLPTIRPGVRAPGRACARLGVPSWASLGVLCTLTQFLTRFDSVLFLSH